jgi:hypothetical protein
MLMSILLLAWTFLILGTAIADPFKVHGLPKDPESLLQPCRDRYIIKRQVVKINDPLASNALKVLVTVVVGVEPLGLTRAFDYKGQVHIRQGQQGTVDRIETDTGLGLTDLLEDCICRGVLMALHQGLIYCNPLWSHLKAFLPAPVLEFCQSLWPFFHGHLMLDYQIW